MINSMISQKLGMAMPAVVVSTLNRSSRDPGRRPPMRPTVTPTVMPKTTPTMAMDRVRGTASLISVATERPRNSVPPSGLSTGIGRVRDSPRSPRTTSNSQRP